MICKLGRRVCVNVTKRWGTLFDVTNALDILIELRRRHVFRVVGIYVVGAWVVLQVADLAFSNFGLPPGAMRYVWFALLAGFPLAVVWGWRYDLTVNGIVRTLPAAAGEEADVRLKSPDYVILAALAGIILVIVGGMLNQIRQLPSAGFVHQTAKLSSVAVLPLENLSGDADQAYFAAGMHDALITSLAKISSLRVISRTSTLRVAKNLTLREIGSRLGVDKVIQGSVTRENDQVRITAQLIDVETDDHVWSENYVRPVHSLVALQNEMATSIASAVEIELTPDELRRLDSRGEIDPDTYDTYLRAMYKFRRESASGIREGIDMLADAVENDPTSALAWAGLAYGYLEIGHSPFPMSPAIPRARAAAERALELDPDLAHAHLTVGMFKLYYGWEFDAAEASLLEALEISPNLVDAHYHLAWLHELRGNHDSAVAYGEQTKVLDPLSPFYSGWLAEQYRAAGRYDQAIAEARETLDLRRDYPVAYIALGNTYLEMGDIDAALNAHANLKESGLWSFIYGATLAQAGRADEAMPIVENLEERGASVPLVMLYAALGEHDKAYEWMMIARDGQAGWYPWLLTWMPQTREMHQLSNVRALAEDIGL